jgi:serine/threonine protein kinase
MELLDGSDLFELGKRPWRQACSVLRDVASALAMLHSRRWLHRDLSPRNVILQPSRLAKLIDFGAMVPMGVARALVGTPPLVPPEAVQQQSLDAQSDLYSLGALAYFMLTGRAFTSR